MKYWPLLLVFVLRGQSYAQGGLCTGSLGDPVVNITFGQGNNPGPTLSYLVPGASTNQFYVQVFGSPATPPPEDGQYTITNNVPFNPTWFFRAPDHTPGDVNGYMAIYNASAQPGEFYRQSINGLCGSTTYEFAAWIANILNPFFRIENLHPDISFRIELPDGTLLASYDTGPITQSNYMNWIQYGLFFTTPPGNSGIVLRMINNTPGGSSNLGNDLAIDDITLRPCGPSIAASFNNGSPNDSVAICHGSTLTLYGAASPGYSNPAYLWQLSTDSGQSWTDIPNSNGLQLQIAPAGNGHLQNDLYRLVTAESVNIQSANCRIASKPVIVVVDPGPQAYLTGLNTCYGQPGKMLFRATDGLPPYLLNYSNNGNPYTQNNLQNGDTFFVPLTLTDTSLFLLESITDGIGCQTTLASGNLSIINVDPLPQGQITGGQGCERDTARLRFQAQTGRPPFTLTLTDGISTFVVRDVPANGPFAIPNNINTITKTYTLLSITDSNGLGCTRSSNFISSTCTLQVLPAPKVIFDPIAPLCQNDGMVVLGGAQETSGIPGNGQFRGMGVSAGGQVDPKLLDPGTYPVQYFFLATNGCADSAIQPLVIKPVPLANAGRDVLGCVNSLIPLNASGGTQYLWSPPDGLSNPAIANPIATGSSTITYTVTVSNDEGCTSTDSMKIIISPLGRDAFRVPNAFTPNGDGKNDCFGIERWGAVELLEFSIYNRWGQRVFFTKDPAECWDGKLGGKPQDTGAYIYVIRAITACGNIALKGSILLLR